MKTKITQFTHDFVPDAHLAQAVLSLPLDKAAIMRAAKRAHRLRKIETAPCVAVPGASYRVRAAGGCRNMIVTALLVMADPRDAGGDVLLAKFEFSPARAGAQ